MIPFESFIKRYGLESLDAQQRVAAETVNGPVLLLAVPGSGKTTTLIARLGYLIYGCDIPAENILTVTFTVAATHEMEARFYKRFGEAQKGKMLFRTINSLCYRIVLAYAKQGYAVPKLVSDGELTPLLREVWKNCGYGWATESDLKGFRLIISNIKNSMMSEDQIRAHDWDISGDYDVPKLYHTYVSAMENRGLMDFDDQMVLSYHILQNNRNILDRLQRQYPYISVDEAQDTSRIQHEIIAMIAAKSRNIFMVGDEDQSIYGFRAACPEELMKFEKRWPGAKVLFIETDYRSTPQIVDAAATFIRQNKSRRDKKMRAVQADGAQIQNLVCPSREQQYDSLVKLAKDANDTGEETAVLYRNNDTALPIIDQLEDQGIPYKAKGVDGLFFTSRIFMDVKAFISLSYNPDDGEAFMTIFNKLGLYLTRMSAMAIADRQNKTVLDALIEMGDDKRRCMDISNTIKQLKDNSPSKAIFLILERLGYRRWLEKQEVDTFRLQILEMLARRDETPAGFLSHMARLQERVKKGAEHKNASFILSTIHSAKGLEYDRVILADVMDGVLPAQTAIDAVRRGENDGMEEERRLFYVGMTRAKKELGIVTFGRACDSFPRAVFPKKNPLPQAPTSSYTHIPSLAHISSQRRKNTKSAVQGILHPGDAVFHKAFGVGRVIDINGDRLRVNFNGMTKDLSLRWVLENKLISQVW